MEICNLLDIIFHGFCRFFSLCQCFGFLGNLGVETGQLLKQFALGADRCVRQDCLCLCGGFSQLLAVGEDGRQEGLLHHRKHRLCLDVDGLDVVLFLDFVAGEEFLLGVDAVFQEQFYVFLSNQARKCLCAARQVEESAFVSFLYPFAGVTVAVEYDVAVITQHFL